MLHIYIYIYDISRLRVNAGHLYVVEISKTSREIEYYIVKLKAVKYRNYLISYVFRAMVIRKQKIRISNLLHVCWYKYNI